MKKQPSYRLHKSSGQAIVTLDGRMIYLGKFGSPESHQRYSEVMREYLNDHRGYLRGSHLSTAEAVLLYLDHADRYYRDAVGQSTRQTPRIKRALGTLVSLHGGMDLRDLGPREIRHCQAQWVSENLSRQYANQLLVCLKTAFKWIAREGLYPASSWVELQLVEPLKVGRTSAPEVPAVVPVPPEDYERTLPHLGEVVRDMVRLQLLTGMRSGELVRISWDQIDTSSPIWIYRPIHHKTRWRNLSRTICIGPQAREILERYLGKDGPIFTHRQKRGKSREIGYQVNGYYHHIARVCHRLGITPWRPGQLRHNAATIIERELGWDAARAVLGHRSVNTTRIYVDSDAEIAARAASKLG